MTLLPVKVGTRFYDSRPVTATDPSYDAGTWCTVSGIKIKPGDYDCIAWKGRDYYKDLDGKRHSYSLVGICGIYLHNHFVNGLIPTEERIEIGIIGVDAGLAGFFQDKPDYDGDSWFEFCDKIRKKDYFITNEGFLTRSGYGDGSYPVYVFRDENGDIIGAEISFGFEEADDDS